MSVVKHNNMYKTSRISGPRHNYLGLELSATPVSNIQVIAVDTRGGGDRQIDEHQLLFAVSRGMEDALRDLTFSVFIKKIEYVPSDTPDYTIYSQLASSIARTALADIA